MCPNGHSALLPFGKRSARTSSRKIIAIALRAMRRYLRKSKREKVRGRSALNVLPRVALVWWCPYRTTYQRAAAPQRGHEMPLKRHFRGTPPLPVLLRSAKPHGPPLGGCKCALREVDDCGTWYHGGRTYEFLETRAI